MGKAKGSSKAKSKSGKSLQPPPTQLQQEPPALAPDGDPRLLRAAAQAALAALPLRTAPPAKCALCDSREGDWHEAAASVVLRCGCESHLRCLFARTVMPSAASSPLRCYACPARGCGRSFLPIARVDDRVRVLAGPAGSCLHGRRGRVAGIFAGVDGVPTACVKLDQAWAPDAAASAAGDAPSRRSAHTAAVVRSLDVHLNHLQVLDARTDQRHPDVLHDTPNTPSASVTDDELIELMPPRVTCGQCGLQRPKDHFSGNQRKRARAENSLPTCSFCVQGPECELRDGVTNERLPGRIPFDPTELDTQPKGAGYELSFKVPHVMAPETLPLRRVTNAALQLHRLGRSAAAGTVARDALELSTGHAGDTAQTAAAKARAVLIRSELARARELQRSGEQARAAEAAKEALRQAQEQLLHRPLEKMVPLRELTINDAGSEGLVDDDGHDHEDWWAAQAKEAQSLIDQGSSPRQAQSPSSEGTPSPSSAERDARSGRRENRKPIQSLNPHEVLKAGKWTSRGKDSRGHTAYVRWVEKDRAGEFVLEKQQFSMSSTPGDLRTRSNELSNLRRKDEGIQATISISASPQALEAHRRIIIAKNDLRRFQEAQLSQEQLLQTSITEAQAALEKLQQAE